MKKIIWSDVAEIKFQSFIEYISLDSSVRALQWMEKVLTTIDNLSEYPYLGKSLYEVNGDSIRALYIGSFQIVYQVYDGENRVEIHKFMHCSEQAEEEE